MFTSPTKAFAAVKEKPVYVLPMILTLLGVAAITGGYYAKVDIAWLQDQMATAAHMTSEQQQQVASRVTRPILLWGSAISAPIATFIIVLLGTLYYTVAGNLSNVRYSFNQWFAFSWWAGSPQIIAFIPSLLILMLSRSTQISASALQPLSLNELIFHRATGTPGYSLLSALGLVQVATLWLTYVGVRAWSGRSTLFCLIFTLLPTVLIYGVWAFFAFRGS
jgi:hypothetical protein